MGGGERERNARQKKTSERRCSPHPPSSLTHLLPLFDGLDREQADPAFSLDGPLLSLGVRPAAVVDESQDAPFLARVDHLPVSEIHNKLVLVFGLEGRLQGFVCLCLRSRHAVTRYVDVIDPCFFGVNMDGCV